MWMRNARVDEYRVALAGIECRPISGLHRYVWIRREIVLSPSRQAGIYLTGCHSPIPANHFSHNRGVIADAATQVINAVPRRELECVLRMKSESQPVSIRRRWLALMLACRGRS